MKTGMLNTANINAEQSADVLIIHGTLIDGTGVPSVQGDLRIRNERIAETGQGLMTLPGEEIIGAQNLMVTPGFIDTHCHTDMYAADYPEACGKIIQGVTTEVCGLCEDSPASIGTGNLEEFCRCWEYQMPGGMEKAEFLLTRSGISLKKYVWGIHIPECMDGKQMKEYCWAYPLRHPVVLGDCLLAETRYGNKLIRVTRVDMAMPGYMESLKKIKKFISRYPIYTKKIITA